MSMVLGVTGGIATGKSTVLAMLKELGAAVLDADSVARDVLAPGSEGESEAISEFGAEILGADGRIDRRKLGERVFGDENALKRLNEITHPRIIAILDQRIGEFRKDHADDGVLAVEIPLLVECDLSYLVDKVIVVVSEQAAQIHRLKMRSKLSAEEAAQRIAAQIPVSEKEEYGDWVVRTDGTLEETRRQVEQIWRQIGTKPQQSLYQPDTTDRTPPAEVSPPPAPRHQRGLSGTPLSADRVWL
ncbi:MAG TPA: dephospho-CoA kinase [Chloroflexota bacterium]|nr:dephospho-CoA kinase [Chloroflexota bacterium]